MSCKRHVLFVTLAVCATVLAAPLPLAGGSTSSEPESSGTILPVDPAPPIAWSASSDPSGDLEEVEAPAQMTETAESETEDVVEEPEPLASTSEEPVSRSPRCMTVTKRDSVRPAPDDSSADDDPAEVADSATDEPAADDEVFGDGADVERVSGEESPDLDEGVITEEPVETIEDGPSE